MIVVAAITAGTIGGLYSSTRTTNPEFDPQSVATPSALLRPQTPADRAPRATFADDTGIVWSTVRLLQSQALARVYGGRDRAGGFCMLVMVDDPNGGTDASADCIAHAPASETEAAAQRFEHQGSALSSYGDGRGAVAFFVPDGIQSVKLGADRIAVEHNSVLVVANHSLGSVMHLRRIGSTLYATK
ncbi:MAG TPA: hypothetical protein VH914_09280 [Acidimicrobiia bacterium]|nr:hypothetical protein [Acidimicrobiia bacterium]